MTISEIPTIPTYSPLAQKQPEHQSPRYTLKWRQGQLLVSLKQRDKQLYLPSLESEQWLVECLKHSPVRLVRIELKLGEATLKSWADACEQANKPVFLRLPAAYELPNKRCLRSWWLKRLIDWSAAALLLLVLSPVILGLVCLMCVQLPQPIFYQQWCVGERGKLFRLLKFRTMVVSARTLNRQLAGNQESLPKREDAPRLTTLGRWLHKYSLDELPQLLNVLRGEMSLVGPRPWNLQDAVRINLEGRGQLNALPGIIGTKQMKVRSSLLDLDTANRCNLEYLRSWSLQEDLKILLMTILR